MRVFTEVTTWLIQTNIRECVATGPCDLCHEERKGLQAERGRVPTGAPHLDLRDGSAKVDEHHVHGSIQVVDPE